MRYYLARATNRPAQAKIILGIALRLVAMARTTTPTAKDVPDPEGATQRLQITVSQPLFDCLEWLAHYGAREVGAEGIHFLWRSLDNTGAMASPTGLEPVALSLGN